MTAPAVRHVVFGLAALASLLHVSRRRLGEAEGRIAALERHNTRLAAEAQQAYRMRDDFLATLSHELRTPLNALLGWVQLLRLHAEEPALRAHAIDVLERNARAQVQLVSDLLDVSRIITGRMRLAFEPVDLAEAVRAASDPLADTAAARQVTLSIRHDPLPGVVWGDAARLRQVVWNLVSNAIRFTPRGGHVRIRAGLRYGAAEISVADTGVGIAPELLPYVFDRFRQGDSSVTRRHGGLGLGLAIVRHLVELHGGTVQVSSAGLNCGATFRVRLPLHATDQLHGCTPPAPRA